MNLTPEQAAILEARDCDIAVSAGAGSGKTHVLVERYIALLESCRIPEIAAVTFTEAAAAEMRDRVRRAVMERDTLEAHRPDLDEAVIGTIHSLCLRLLREHPVEAGIDPTAAVLPEDEAELLRRAACVAAVDAATESGDERTGALGALGPYWTERLLPNMVAARDDVRRAYASMGDGPSAWEAHIHARLDEVFGATRAPLRAQADEALEALRALRGEVAANLGEVVERVLVCMDAPGDWLVCAQEAAAAVDRRRGSRTPGSPDMRAKDAMQAFKVAVGALAAVPEWNEADAAALRALVGLRALFEDVCARYEAAKQEAHGLDFLDLEVRAVALLRDHSAVARETRARFRHLMVDEAQDVSPVQAELILLLLGTGELEPGALRPWFFLVGDVKQSIYRFRGADVAQFEALQQEVAGRGGRLLPLSRSFRTHDGLVDAFNDLFEHAFAGDPLGQARMDRLSGRGPGPDGVHFTMIPISTKERGGDADGRAYARRKVEAWLVAAEVARLLDEGAPVWNKRTRAYEPVEPRHIAILLRRFTNVHIFEQALEDHGIPYATPSGTGFFTRQEVLDLTNLLRWLSEPEDQIALAGVLRSPMFLLGDDTLLTLAQRRSLWRSLRGLLAHGRGRADEALALPEADRARCLHAARVLMTLRDLAAQASPDAVLERALHATGMEAAWAPLDGGEQALANIRKFARLVRGLAGYTLAEVVTYLEQRREDLAVREGPAVLDRVEAVQIMTVHGAKGLEFPVVFVPEAQVDTFQSWDVIKWRPADGVSVTLEPEEGDTRRPRPAFYSALRTLDARADDSEHIRLFYVAATRAADRLYLSGDDVEKGWLGDVQEARAAGLLRSVEVRPTVLPSAVDLRRARRVRWSPPPEGEETPYVSPLVDRPAVVPLRSSTPVTALRRPLPETSPDYAAGAAAAGDGLGLLRGNVAHRAIEETFRDGARPDLAALTRQEAQRALDVATVEAVAREVAAILDRFDASDLAAALRRPEAEPRFEAPFAWDWDGIPVHGSVDLIYRDGGGWVVVDFKTDQVGAGGARRVAERYLVQVGLYGRALEAATGQRPRVGLLFLRTGELLEPDWAEVDRALAEARGRVEQGGLLDPEEAGDPAEALEDALA